MTVTSQKAQILVALRSLDVRKALDFASNVTTASPGDPASTFLEGTLAYSMRCDTVALERFRESMRLEPLFAEVPYYIGQILVESAIDDYERSHPGPITAEMALRWARTYDSALTAFAWAEEISNSLSLKSIPQHLRTYNMLLGVDRFSSVATMQSEMPSIDYRYTTPDKWLSLIGFHYNEQEIDRREVIAELVSNLAAEPSIVFVIGNPDILRPISILLSRRKLTSIFEVGPTMPDEMLKVRLSSIKAGSAVLTDARRIGFGGYFSWAPLGAEVLHIVFVNPHHFLSVELLGLLARIGLDNPKAPTVRFTLVNFVTTP